MKHQSDVIIVGGGPAGVAAALAAATKHRQITLIDEHGTGGGPYREQAMVASFAQAAQATKSFAEARTAALNFRDQQIKLRPTKHALQAAGIAVVTGHAEFSSPDCLRLGRDNYTAKWFVIATGSLPLPLKLGGGEHASSPIELLEQPKQPERLVILGTSPVLNGLAHALATLGTTVTVVTSDSDQPNDSHGLIHTINGRVGSIEQLQRAYRINLSHDNEASNLVVDVVIAAGQRQPNMALNLAAADITASEQGIAVDRNLRTTNRHVYAAGSCLEPQPGSSTPAEQGHRAGQGTISLLNR